MQKVWKKIVLLASLFCLTLGCGVLAACGNKEEDGGEKTKYTLKVVLPNEDAVEGVEITFTNVETGKANAPIVTGANGIASAEYPETEYRVAVTESTLPDGYGLSASDKNMTTKSWGEGITSYVIYLTESTKTYSVTVTLPNGSPAADVDVIFTASGQAPVKATTDASGKVSVTLPSDQSYLVTLDASTLPDNATVKAADANGISTANGTAISFALVTPYTYTFEVSGPADADLSGIPVSYAATTDGVRIPLGTTDANGKLVTKSAPITGYAFITAPSGFVYNEYYENTDSKPCPYVLTERTPIRFTLLRHKNADPAPMTDTEKTAYKEASGNSTFASLCGSDERTLRAFDATLTANELQVFSFRATEKGSYDIFLNADNVTLKIYDTLNLNSPLAELANKDQAIYLNSERNRTYYISLQSSNGGNVKVALADPPETNETEVYETGTFNLTIKEKLPADFKFHPAQSGIYKVTIENGNSGYLIDTMSPATHRPIPGESSENGTMILEVLSGEITSNQASYRWLRFSSTATSPSYPIDIKVTVERTGDLIEQTVIVTDISVQETLTKYASQEGTLTQLGVDGTNARLVKGADGYYHLDGEDGPVVVIKLKGTIDLYYPEIEFENLDENSAEYTIYVSSDTFHLYYVNYAKFLRGYNNGDKDNTSAYASEYYLKYVNNDGVYPLNDELKTFLTRMATKNKSWLMSNADGYTDDSLWLFSAYFYNDGSYVQPDPPIAPAPVTGSGTQEDPYLLAFASGETTLQTTVSIDKTISDQTGEEIADSKYFRFTATEAGYYVLKTLHRDAQFSHWDGTSFKRVGSDEKQYAYYGTALEAGETLEFTLTCSAQKNYPFTYSYSIVKTDPPAAGSKDNPVAVEGKAYTIDLKAGETYFFEIDMNEGYTISYSSENVKVYNFGGSVSNDDRITADYLVASGSEVLGIPSTLVNTYIGVIASEDCRITISFTQVENNG